MENKRYANIWLDLDEPKNHYLSNNVLTDGIVRWQQEQTPAHQAELEMYFDVLASAIVKYTRFKNIGLTRDEQIKELVQISFAKVNRFNPCKGKAFNYFTTVMINQLRQLYRKHKAIKDKEATHD